MKTIEKERRGKTKLNQLNPIINEHFWMNLRNGRAGRRLTLSIFI